MGGLTGGGLILKPTAWSPSDLGSVLVAEYNAKVSTIGNPTVTALNDTGFGGTYNLSAVGTPQFDGSDIITFDGTTEYMDGDSHAANIKSDLGTGGELIIFGARTSDIFMAMLAIGNSAVADSYFRLAHRQTAFNSKIEFDIKNGLPFNRIRSTNSFNDANFHRVFMSSDGANYKMVVDGTNETLDIVSGSDNGEWIQDLVSSTNTFQLMGHLFNTVQFYYSGDLKYAAITSRQLTTQERSDYNNFLSNL